MIVLSVLQKNLNLLNNPVIVFALSGLTSFFVTFFLVPLVIVIAQKYHILDEPDGKIKTHGRSVAYLGGLAVFVGFAASYLIWGSVDARISFLLLGCCLLMIIGFVDDLLTLKPSVKFAGQAVVAISFIRAGLYLKESFFNEMWVIAIPFSLLWLLTCMNMINLIDVMDGLASVVSITAALGYLGIALFNGNYATAQLLLLFIGALLGFLGYNKPPARIYLGDAGSLFIGGFLGVIPFLLSWSDHVSWGFLLPPLPLTVAFLELFGLIIIRTIKGIPFYKGSKDHFCHYLQRQGWRVGSILWFVVAINSLAAFVALFAYKNAFSLPILIMLGIPIAAIWLLAVKYTGLRIRQ